MNDKDYELAEMEASDSRVVQICILVKYGWDYDLADALPDYKRFAYVVIYKRIYENMMFIWNERRWKPVPPPKTKKF